MLCLRPASPDDREFLFRVYASTRTEELALTDWSETQKEAFLRMQFNAQHVYYAEHYRSARFQVIEHRGMPIGRLYVDQWPDEVRIVDIALLPQWRNQGFGSQLIREIIAQAEQAGLPVTIHVEMFNPALRLYQRLGFAPAGTHGVYYLMKRDPSTNQSSVPSASRAGSPPAPEQP
jgi:ribosomal protein S18 acetylase RimI-like enzyme